MIRGNVELLEAKDKFKKSTRDYIQRQRTHFERILSERKSNCISLYTEFLNQQEELLLYKLRTLGEVHMVQYEGNPTIESLQELLKKSDADLLVEHEAIDTTTAKQVDKPTLKISLLTLSDVGFRSDTPLGDLELRDVDRVGILDGVVCSTLKDSFPVTKHIETAPFVADTKEHEYSDATGVVQPATISSSGVSKEKKRKRDDDLKNNPLCRDHFDITEWVSCDNSSSSRHSSSFHHNSCELFPVHTKKKISSQINENVLRNSCAECCTTDYGVKSGKTGESEDTDSEPFDITQLM